MKKIFCLMLALLMLTPSLLHAEDVMEMDDMLAMGQDEEMMPPMMGQPGMGRPGKMCCGMKGKPSMVASEDGGVIVLVGNTLQKFDADLNFIKETEIKIPAPSMKDKEMWKKQKEDAPEVSEEMPLAPVEETVPVEEIDVVEELDFQAV